MSLRLDGLEAQIDAPLPGDPTEPADMAPTDRLGEVAGILARGILRLNGRVPADLVTAAHPRNPSESSATRLELSAPPRPDGATG